MSRGLHCSTANIWRCECCGTNLNGIRFYCYRDNKYCPGKCIDSAFEKDENIDLYVIVESSPIKRKAMREKIQSKQQQNINSAESSCSSSSSDKTNQSNTVALIQDLLVNNNGLKDQLAELGSNELVVSTEQDTTNDDIGGWFGWW